MNKNLEPSNAEVWIVNYKRFEHCNNTAKMWLNSFPFERINIISNHSSQNLEHFDADIRPKIKIYQNSLRPDDQVGSLAECWNRCYINTFNTKYWCFCSQDDVIIEKGWLELIQKTNREFYSSPLGDLVHVNTKDNLKKVGYWDERFRTTCYQELDYISRCMIYNKDNCCIIDGHQWNIRHNCENLDHYFKDLGKINEHLWETKRMQGDSTCEMQAEYIRSKYKFPLYDRRNLEQPPQFPEIDWYPQFTKKYLK